MQEGNMDDSGRRRRNGSRGMGLATRAGLVACLLLIPGLAGAQQVGGTVTDTNGHGHDR
jgi:hypothetical protein